MEQERTSLKHTGALGELAGAPLAGTGDHSEQPVEQGVLLQSGRLECAHYYANRQA
jgi:hypothetical protein